MQSATGNLMHTSVDCAVDNQAPLLLFFFFSLSFYFFSFLFLLFLLLFISFHILFLTTYLLHILHAILSNNTHQFMSQNTLSILFHLLPMQVQHCDVRHMGEHASSVFHTAAGAVPSAGAASLAPASPPASGDATPCRVVSDPAGSRSGRRSRGHRLARSSRFAPTLPCPPPPRRRPGSRRSPSSGSTLITAAVGLDAVTGVVPTASLGAPLPSGVPCAVPPLSTCP